MEAERLPDRLLIFNESYQLMVCRCWHCIENRYAPEIGSHQCGQGMLTNNQQPHQTCVMINSILCLVLLAPLEYHFN
jgi:hypothetical protein